MPGTTYGDLACVTVPVVLISGLLSHLHGACLPSHNTNPSAGHTVGVSTQQAEQLEKDFKALCHHANPQTTFSGGLPPAWLALLIVPNIIP